MAGDNRASELLRVAERAAYFPLLGHLPAAVGYSMARRRGDWLFRYQGANRAEIARNLQLVLGNELSPAAVQQATLEWFRISSCAMVDSPRLRHDARPMRRLVEIRGREHLEAALAAGKGAILCHGHFGSHGGGCSVLHTSGFPVTSIGRTWYNYDTSMSSVERRVWERYLRPMQRLRQRPNIEPWPGRPQVAVQAAMVLRANEVVTIAIDAPPQDSDQGRVIDVPFLGRSARLLPGAAVLAQVTGAPLLMSSMYRAPDYRHQLLEISAPIPVQGDTATVFQRCAAELSAAILRSPAQWETWSKTDDLVKLGLIRADLGDSRAAEPTAQAGTAPL